MTQEVKVVLSLEVDTSLSKEQIEIFIKKLLDKSNSEFILFGDFKVMEEWEIYENL